MLWVTRVRIKVHGIKNTLKVNARCQNRLEVNN